MIDVGVTEEQQLQLLNMKIRQMMHQIIVFKLVPRGECMQDGESKTSIIIYILSIKVMQTNNDVAIRK